MQGDIIHYPYIDAFLIISAICISVFHTLNKSYILDISSLTFGLVILGMAPVDTTVNRYTPIEKNRYRNITRIIVILILITYLILEILSFHKIQIAITLSLFFEMIMLVWQYIKNCLSDRKYK